MQQMSLLSKTDLRHIKRYTHGGVSLKKRRKVKRPLIPGKVTHVTFKSSKAKGKLSFYRHRQLVGALLRKTSKKFFIEILDWVNMGNHLHLKVRFNDPKRMGQFLRSFSGNLARQITGAKKGNKFGKFWDGLAFTRVLTSKLEELGLKGYFEGNHIQRELGYAERERYLKSFNQFLYRLRRVRARSKRSSIRFQVPKFENSPKKGAKT